eukprot:9263429-Karenia_brevis.AAC.1
MKLKKISLAAHISSTGMDGWGAGEFRKRSCLAFAVAPQSSMPIFEGLQHPHAFSILSHTTHHANSVSTMGYDEIVRSAALGGEMVIGHHVCRDCGSICRRCLVLDRPGGRSSTG